MNDDYEFYVMEYTKKLLSNPVNLWEALSPDSVEDDDRRAQIIYNYIEAVICCDEGNRSKNLALLGHMIYFQAIQYVRERAEEKARKYMSSDEYKESLKYPGI